MKSGIDVRHEGNKFTLTTDLVVHYGIMDIPNQTTEFICILDVVKESLNIPLLCQWIEFLENVFQFPNSPFSSGLNLTQEGVSLPSQFSPPHFFLAISFRDGFTERGREGLDPGCQ